MYTVKQYALWMKEEVDQLALKELLKMKENDLIERATQLANDIDEYAPDTNIALMMRELIIEILELRKERDEKLTLAKS